MPRRAAFIALEASCRFSEKAAQIVDGEAGIIEYRREGAALDDISSMNVNGRTSIRVWVLHEMCASPNAKNDKPRALEGAEKTLALDRWKLLTHA